MVVLLASVIAIASALSSVHGLATVPQSLSDEPFELAWRRLAAATHAPAGRHRPPVPQSPSAAQATHLLLSQRGVLFVQKSCSADVHATQTPVDPLRSQTGEDAFNILHWELAVH